MSKNWTFDVSEQSFDDNDQRFWQANMLWQHFDDGEQCFKDSELSLDDSVHQGQSRAV